MKLFKRALSALLALNMMITLLPLNITNASQADNASGSYTVTLLTSENGSASFTEESKTTSKGNQNTYQLMTVNEAGELVPVENDGSVWSFSVGDTVEIALTPQSGYNVKSFVIKDADNNVLASKETTDNMFSFQMVDRNLTIESNFVSSSTNSNVKDTNENKNEQLTYKKEELVDATAINVQNQIDNLPETMEITNNAQENIEIVSSYVSLVENASDLYFNELTDEQKAQVDSSKLFANKLELLQLQQYTSEEEKKSFSDEEVFQVREIINNLPELNQITNIIEAGKNGEKVNNHYGDGTEMYISAEEQNELFSNVLTIAEFMVEADENSYIELGVDDFTNVDTLVNYFSVGVYSDELDQTTMFVPEILTMDTPMVYATGDGLGAGTGVASGEDGVGNTGVTGTWTAVKMHKAHPNAADHWQSSYFKGTANIDGESYGANFFCCQPSGLSL